MLGSRFSYPQLLSLLEAGVTPAECSDAETAILEDELLTHNSRAVPGRSQIVFRERRGYKSMAEVKS